MKLAVIRQFRDLAGQGLLLAVLLAAIFPATFLSGEMISPGIILFETAPWNAHTPPDYEPVTNRLASDALNQFHMWYVLVEESLAQGDWPLWNPLQLGGLPLHANYQSAIFYPARFWHRFLDIHVASTLFILQKIWLCGMTAYIFARGIGMASDLSRLASVGWMLSGYLMTWTYWPEPDIAAWLPIFVLGIERTLACRWRQGFFTMLFASTMLMYAGHPESAFTQAAISGLYFIIRLALHFPRRAQLWKSIACAGGVWIITLPVSAVQLLPFIEYLPLSYTFNHRPELDPAEHSIPVYSAIAFFVPRFFGLSALQNYWGYWNSNFTTMIYPGIACWVGISLLCVKSGNRDRFRPYYVPLTIASLIAILLTFDIPTLNFIKSVPVLSSLWYFWFIGFAALAIPLLAALGYRKWLDEPRRLIELRWSVLAAAVTYTILFALYGYYRGQSVDEQYSLTQVLISAAFVVTTLSIAALHCLGVRRSVIIWAITAVLVVDLVYAASSLHPTVKRRDLYVDTELTDFLRARPVPNRVSVKSARFPDELGTGILQGYGIEQLWGYDGIYPARMIEFLGLATTPNWLNVEPLLAIDAYLFNADQFDPESAADRFEALGTFETITVCRNIRAMPRAYLIGTVQTVDSKQAVLDMLGDPNTDPLDAVLTAEPPPEPLPQSKSRDVGTAAVTARSNVRVTVDVNAKQPCTLVLADAYYPGWNVTIDKEPGHIFPAYHALRGVVLSQGRHTVTFEYSPAGFRYGLLISTVALIGNLIAAIVILIRYRATRPIAKSGAT